MCAGLSGEVPSASEGPNGGPSANGADVPPAESASSSFSYRGPGDAYADICKEFTSLPPSVNHKEAVTSSPDTKIGSLRNWIKRSRSFRVVKAPPLIDKGSLVALSGAINLERF